MRIDGKRASAYTNEQIYVMLRLNKTWFTDEKLTRDQADELKKVLERRTNK